MKKKKDPNEIRISAKNLGELNMPDFDPQGFWLKNKVGNRIPFSIFPGIFSTLDKYQKDITSFLNVYNGKWPTWVCGNIAEQIVCPHWSKFSYVDEETGIIVSGAMDECFRLVDDTLLISDNKLAKYTEGQDKLLPMYLTQLNAYADIAEKTGLGKVSALQLVYHEPITGLSKDEFDKYYIGESYLLRFTPKVIEIPRDPELVPRLLRKAKAILASPTIPEPADGRISKDMELFVEMYNAYQRGQQRVEVSPEIQSEKTPEEVQPEKSKTKHLKVSCDGKFIGGLEVPSTFGDREILDWVFADPLLQMVQPDIAEGTHNITWE